MSTLKKDCNSLYLKVGGYIFRPIFPKSEPRFYKFKTVLTEDDVGLKIKARHLRGSSKCLLKFSNNNQEIEEYWYSHGAYMGENTSKESSDHFQPQYENWF